MLIKENTKVELTGSQFELMLIIEIATIELP